MGRIFDPVVKGFDEWEKPSDVVWYDDEDDVSRLCKVSKRSRTPVVMWTNGACDRNGSDYANAGYGIHLGRKSFYNCYDELPSRERQTSEAAKIYAARMAVGVVMHEMDDDECVMDDGVVIVTDLENLCLAMTCHIYKWIKNDFTNAEGRLVKNAEAFEDLHDEICDWEDSGINIRFWQVTKEHNKRAKRLARKALDY